MSEPSRPSKTFGPVEWPTLALILLCYLAFLALLFGHASLGLPVAILLLGAVLTLHSSLQHEALHGHPTRSRRLNEALVLLPLGLAYPYRRFRALHIRHHQTPELTDPYDDPESFYLAWRDWAELPRPLRALLAVNNTLLGRLIVGPALSVPGFLLAEWRLARAGGEAGQGLAWALHLAGIAVVLLFVGVAGMPIWAYLLAAYIGLSLLGLRTFAEHQASEHEGERTAVIEASPFFGLLFLNNNLHAVHHARPSLPWYRLPAAYRAEREAIAAAGGRVFDGYLDIARRYLLSPRAPIPHPHRRREAA